MNKLTKLAAFIAVTSTLTGCDDETARWWHTINPWDSGWTILIIAFTTLLLHAFLTKGKEPNLIKALIGFATSLVVVQIIAMTSVNLGWVALATGLPALSWMIYVEIADHNKPTKSLAKSSLRQLVKKEGLQLETATTACQCGKQNRTGYKFCGACGKPSPKPITTKKQRPTYKKGRGRLNL